MIQKYRTLLDKCPEDYEHFLQTVISARKDDGYRMMAFLRDRGSKYDIVQDYRYDPFSIINYISNNSNTGRWFSSMYLSWVLHETEVTCNNLSLSFDIFCLFSENDLYRRLIETNRYECYGFCLTALTLLDKDFLLKYNGEKKYLVQKLAIEGIVTYLHNHKGINPLWDAELYSGYARLFDIFRADMTGLLLDNMLGSYAQYSYCFGMYEAYKCAPIECEYKIEFHKNALMMQQNQTVVGVTSDPMDANLVEAVLLGKSAILGVYRKNASV